MVVRTTVAFVRADGSREVQPAFTHTRHARLVHDGMRFVEARDELGSPWLTAIALMSAVRGPEVALEIPALSLSSATGGADYQPNEPNQSGHGIVGIRAASGSGPLTGIIAHDASGNVNVAMRTRCQQDGDTWIASSVQVRARIDTTIATGSTPTVCTPKLPRDVQAIELTSHAQPGYSPMCEKTFGPVLSGTLDLGTPCRTYAASAATAAFGTAPGLSMTVVGNRMANYFVARGIGQRVMVQAVVEISGAVGIARRCPPRPMGVACSLGCDPEGFPALADAPRAGRGHGITAALEAKIVRLTLQTKPPAPLTHWSSRRLAAKLDVAHTTVTTVWKRHGLKPHRLERYKGSPDPDFETKAADIIGLYIDPPVNAGVFCVDEQTAIQALDRTDPVLPLRPGRAETHGFEYVRHGTRALYAALDVATGHVQGQVAARHTSAEFVDFLDTVTRSAPRGKAVHFVVDHFSAHKTQAVKAWLAAHPRVTMHDTPTYSNWLNQVESWFARIERDCIARGIFTSTTDLTRKLLRYITLHNKTCQPFVWRYRDVTRRMPATRNATTTH